MPDRGITADLPGFVAALDERLRRLERGIQIKAARTVVAVVAVGAIVDVDVNWPTPFTDADYTVAVTVSAGGGAWRMLIIVRHDPSGITCRLQNVGATPQAGTVHAIGIHD